MPRWQFIPNDTPVERCDELVWGWWVAPEMNEVSTIAINIRLFDGTRGPTVQLSPDRSLTGLLIEVAKATDMPIATFRLQFGTTTIPDGTAGRVLSDVGLSDGSIVSMVGTGVGGGKRGGVKKNGLKDKDGDEGSTGTKRFDRLVLLRHKALTMTNSVQQSDYSVVQPVQFFLTNFWAGLSEHEARQDADKPTTVRVLSEYLREVPRKDLCQALSGINGSGNVEQRFTIVSKELSSGSQFKQRCDAGHAMYGDNF